MSRIDIVIPAAGRLPDLLRLLRSLEEHGATSLAQHVASITVTDDRPADNTRAVLADAFSQVRYVAGPTRGPAANRNHGAAQGHAPWVLFLDDDCYLESDLVAAYARRIADPVGVGIFEGAIRSVGQRPNGNHHAPPNTTGGCLWSCNLLVRRSLFESIGGFDPRFPFACMEDVDLRERLFSAGALAQFAPDAWVLHPWRSISERELSRQIISHAIYAEKHPSFVREWTLLHAARMAWGRFRLYASNGFGTIPWSKYRTVAYDLVAPFLLLVVTRWQALRRGIDGRYRNGSLLEAGR